MYNLEKTTSSEMSVRLGISLSVSSIVPILEILACGLAPVVWLVIGKNSLLLSYQEPYECIPVCLVWVPWTILGH